MTAFYNEKDKYAASWLRNLIAAGLIAPGVVDERDIRDIKPADVAGFTQVHWFGGIGGWSYALRLAGWPDSRECWSGSCPCQPFSAAGARLGFADDRHLWPVWERLIAERRPPVVFGEQSARASDWLRLVRSDLEALGYAVGAVPIEAASAGARQLRDRYWFVASLNDARQSPFTVNAEMALPSSLGASADSERLEIERAWETGEQQAAVGTHWWAAEPDVGIVAYGVPARMAKIRAYGNAIVPALGAEFVKAFLEATA